MSPNEPQSLGVLRCAHCKSKHVRVNLMTETGGLMVDHIDVYCWVCNQFVKHMSVSPYAQESPPEHLEVKKALDDVNKYILTST
jgi:hypothetical protein